MADPKEEHDIPADSAEEPNHDPQFEPIVSLPEQDVKTLEEDEEELFKMRAKLFRFATENKPQEWKERGTGDVKLLKHKEKGTIRLLMRRDKTLKICANHHIVPTMELKSNAGSDRAWVWNTLADYADESPKPELLAIRFLNAENAQKFKAKFDECKEEVRKQKGDTATNARDERQGDTSQGDEDDDDEEEEEEEEAAVSGEASVLGSAAGVRENTDKVAEKLEELSVKVKTSEEKKKEEKKGEEGKEVTAEEKN
ncbi:ran-specific GTPase-activating protein isoform X2 [Cynoglossus semilaevis]|uniref:Ran-specific GTPase-activating protein n=1 Tax=Cynoglossus semilaevis TaxID=244447 RepID=A0A3P8VUP6_CYNSE|nr:ran-specific GTPase-activating protein isoform X2 [Cynoglossus semilaevis]